MYSCAIFPEVDADAKATPAGELEDQSNSSKKPINWRFDYRLFAVPDVGEELHNAQMTKIEHIIRRAQIQPGHRILEVRVEHGFFFIPIDVVVRLAQAGASLPSR